MLFFDQVMTMQQTLVFYSIGYKFQRNKGEKLSLRNNTNIHRHFLLFFFVIIVIILCCSSININRILFSFLEAKNKKRFIVWLHLTKNIPPRTITTNSPSTLDKMLNHYIFSLEQKSTNNSAQNIYINISTYCIV